MKTLKKGIFQITDSVIALGILLILLVVMVIPAANWTVDEYRNTVAAGQARIVQSAVNKYISDNAITISATATPTNPVTLTVPTLINAGYLPTGYSSTNNFSATYETKIFQPMANKFHVMTFLTGGIDLKLSQARKIATKIGATGGYIEKGVAKGALGAWTENLSAFGGFNPGDGHIVIAGFYQNGALSNDFLYRKSVPGRPELNTMNTALNMGSNDVNNAGMLQAQNATLASTLTATTINATNATISETLNTATVNATGTITSSDIVQGKYFYPSQEVNVGQGCPLRGMIGRDNTGQSVSCVNGVWAKSSGVPVGTIAIWGSPTIPVGWLECNGQNFNTAAYSELAAYYPTGRVPDFRGLLLRGLDRGVGRDSQPGRGLLSYQEDSLQNHTHLAGAETGFWGGDVPVGPTRNTPGSAVIKQYQARTGDVNPLWGGARIAGETRPKNMAVLYIIKAQ